MKNVIETLRELDGKEGGIYDDDYDTIDTILDTYNPKGYTVKTVYHDFEEGGRWYNIKTDVYKVEQDGEVAYFELWREVPASEMQEGTDLSWGFYEVVPKEVTVIRYLRKGDAQ